jgi:hypothetical protein
MAQPHNAAHTHLVVGFFGPQLQSTCRGTGGFLMLVEFKVGTRREGRGVEYLTTPSEPTVLL